MPDSPTPAPGTILGSDVTLRFTDMAYGGDAVGRLGPEGVAVFAWPAIQGEEATVRITEERKNLLRAQVAEIIDPSPYRVEPPCPYFGPCGGCQWQHISYEGQLRFKNSILQSQLNRLGGLSDLASFMADPVPSSKDYGYRNTSHFAIDAATKSIGYFKRDSHTVVPVEQCPISNVGINAMIPLANSLLQSAEAAPQATEIGRRVMRVWHITIRHSERTGQTLLILHTRAEGRAVSRRSGRGRAHPSSRPDVGPSLEPDTAASAEIPLVRREARRVIARFPDEVNGLPLALTAVEIMEDGTINLLGTTRAAGSLFTEVAADMVSGRLVSAEISGQEIAQPLGSWVETLAGRHYWVAPEAFFQANTDSAEALLNEVLAHVPSKLQLVVDAHAGVGTFGLALASRARRVLMFETSNAAIASGRWTALASDLNNVEFQHGKAETLLSRLPAAEKPDLVVLDPPRTGCHPDLLKEIDARQVPLIIYVSCDPSTLARDIKLLSPSYNVTFARLVDMFPQTFHIETVAVLERT